MEEIVNKKNYEVSEENVISDEDSSDDDFIKITILLLPQTININKGNKKFYKSLKFKYMYGERAIKIKYCHHARCFVKFLKKT